MHGEMPMDTEDHLYGQRQNFKLPAILVRNEHQMALGVNGSLSLPVAEDLHRADPFANNRMKVPPLQPVRIMMIQQYVIVNSEVGVRVMHVMTHQIGPLKQAKQMLLILMKNNYVLIADEQFETGIVVL